jgi:hypothetical protein
MCCVTPGPLGLGTGQVMTTAGLEVLKAQYNVSVSSQAPQALAQDAASHQRAAHLVERIAAAVTAKLNNATMAVQVRPGLQSRTLMVILLEAL